MSEILSLRARFLERQKILAHDCDVFARDLTQSNHETWIYNPLQYAWRPWEELVNRELRKHVVLFLGMNPGPFGMAQTGIPFGAVPVVRDFLDLGSTVDKPEREHPKRPVTGLSCPRVEVSGKRLWGFVAAHFGSAGVFFERGFVLNHCPLVFMSESGANVTPDKLETSARKRLERLCTDALADCIAIIEPKALVGVGNYAFDCLESLGTGLTVARIPHPSPANPGSHADWETQVIKALDSKGLWPLPT